MTTSATHTRLLGQSNIEVSALGVGCWAIGGPWMFNDAPAGWSRVDDAESLRALHHAMDLGVNFFDTAANYGAGHSERLLGRAVTGRRGDVVIATKFGYAVDEETRRVVSYDVDENSSDVAARVRTDLAASLRRLATDYIDLYQLHVWGLTVERALEVRDVLEQLVTEGTILAYGWSTDRVDAVTAFATSPHCVAVQQELSVLDDTGAELLMLCEELGLASINRGPLGMGLLTGKFSPSTTFAPDDQRRSASWHPGFRKGQPTQEWLDRLTAIRHVLTDRGHTLAQGALAWLWARSPNTIPIPGFKTVSQVEENCRALERGPLSREQLDEIEQILDRELYDQHPPKRPGSTETGSASIDENETDPSR